MENKKTYIGLMNNKNVYINIAEGLVNDNQLKILKDFLGKISSSSGMEWSLPLLPKGASYRNGGVVKSESLVICVDVLKKLFLDHGMQMKTTDYNIINRMTNINDINNTTWNIIISTGGNIHTQTKFKTLNNDFKKSYMNLNKSTQVGPIPISNSNNTPRLPSSPTNPINIPKSNNNDTYKVLSYNVSWEAMAGVTSKAIKIKCQMGNNDVTKCLSNIKNFIHTEYRKHDYDIIGLQEATDWRKLYTEEMGKKYDFIASCIRNEDMVTFYKRGKLTLDSDLGASVVITYMEDVGRPMMILFFNNNLCVINLHAGHKNDILKINDHLANTFNQQKFNNSERMNPGYKSSNRSTTTTEKPPYNFSEIIRKLKTYKIIVLGDMNFDMNSYIRKKTLLNINIVNESRILYTDITTPYIETCCDETFGNQNKKHKYKNDHILATKSDIKLITYTRQNVPSPSSDHLPIGATINFSPYINKGNQIQKGGKALYFKTKTDYLRLKSE